MDCKHRNIISDILRHLNGRLEDLSADDATWGYPNVFGDYMIQLDDEIRQPWDEMLESVDECPQKYQEAFEEACRKSVDYAMNLAREKKAEISKKECIHIWTSYPQNCTDMGFYCMLCKIDRKE